MAIIALAGAADSGKGWVSARLVQNHGFTPVRFSDTIKRMLATGFGLTSEQTDGEGRDIPIPELGGFTPLHLVNSLSAWGRRSVHSDAWVEAWRRSMRSAPERVVVDDLRHPNEAMAVRAAGGVIWKIDRPDRPSLDVVANTVRQLPSDHTIVNDSTIAALVHRVDISLQEYLASL